MLNFAFPKRAIQLRAGQVLKNSTGVVCAYRFFLSFNGLRKNIINYK